MSGEHVPDIDLAVDLVVGSLIASRPEEDRAVFEEERELVSLVQDQLREEGVVVDLLAQPGTEVWEGSIDNMGAVYQLSRFAVHIERGDDLADVIEDGPVIGEELDRAVTDVWDSLTTTRFVHLVNFQGINSYFLPVDFAAPIWLPFTNDEGLDDDVYFGSAVQLQQELADLGTQLVNAGISVQSDAYRTLEILRESAAQSLNYNLPIVVW